MLTPQSILSVTLLLFTFVRLQATHITGAELVYTCLNPATHLYRVDMTVYIDCLNGATTYDPTVDIFIFRSIDNSLYTRQTVNFSGQSTRINPTNQNQCVGATVNQCVDYAVYSFDIVLPPIPGGYDIAWARCCRNNVVTNIAQQEGITVLSHVPGSDEAVGCNSMPRFNQIPPIFLCVGQPFNFDHSATDPDGDSLVYVISNPYHSLNTTGFGATAFAPAVNAGNPMGPPPYQNVDFLPGYSYQDPFGSGNFRIDPQSGRLSLIPTQVGLSVFAVSVREYRNGVLLSENKRDFQINVVQCQPQGDPPQVTRDLSLIPSRRNDTIFARVDQGFCYTLRATDPAAADSVVLFPASAAFGIGGNLPPPYARLTSTGNNPTRGQVCWTPGCDYAGDTLPLIVGSRDPGDCPGYNLVYDTVYVVVEPAPAPQLRRNVPGDTLPALVNQPICYDLTAIDAADLLPVAGPFDRLGGTATLTQTGTAPLNGQVCWTPDCDDAGGFFRLVVEAPGLNRCQQPDRDTVVIAVREGPALGVDPGGALCAGDTTQLRAFGGTAYQWTPAFGLQGANTATPLAFPLTTTTYRVNITDSLGCSQGLTVDLTVNPLPEVQVSDDTTVCGNQGVRLQASGGTRYQWSPPAGLSDPNVASPLARPDSATTYTVRVRDASGCQDSATVTVSPFAIRVSPADTLCPGDSTTLEVRGGQAYSWTPANRLLGANTAKPVVFPTQTTTYRVQADNGAGCLLEEAVTVVVNPPPTLTFGLPTQVCAGDSLRLRVNGAAVYQWQADPTLQGTNRADPLVFPAATQWYYVEGRGPQGCVGQDSVAIQVNPLPEVTTSGDQVICAGESTRLEARGGSSYRWRPAATLSAPDGPRPMASPTQTTRYAVAVQDALGCQAEGSLQVTVNPRPEVYAGPDTAICVGQPVRLRATGGLRYRWEGDRSLSDSTAAAPTAMPTADQVYRVWGQDANGCEGEATVRVTVELPVQPGVPDDTVVCPGSGLTLVATGAHDYLWSNGSTEAVATFFPVRAERLWVLPVGTLVCPVDTAFIEVRMDPALPVASFVPEPDEGYAPLAVSFLNQSRNAGRYRWLLGDDSTTTTAAPIHCYDYPGRYEVRLLAYNPRGCVDTARYRFIRVREANMFIPSAFTPNADGFNDQFTFQSNAVASIEVAIYNRWGQEIIRGDQLDFAWDGRLPSGRPAPEGTYVYVIRAETNRGTQFVREGTLMLLR